MWDLVFFFHARIGLTLIVLQTLWEYSSPIGCKFVLDYTKYNTTAELPVDWLKLCIEFIPIDLRQKIHAMYYLNANALTQRYLRKFFLVSPGKVVSKYLEVEVDIIDGTQNRIWPKRFEHSPQYLNYSSTLATWRAYGKVQLACVQSYMRTSVSCSFCRPSRS
jgi:hypothetical protein